MAPIFDYSSPEIDSFLTMFDAADHTPTLVAEAALDSVFVSPVSIQNIKNEGFVKIFPTLTLDGHIFIQPRGNVQINRVQVWNSSGQIVWDKPFSNSNEPLQLPQSRGVYFVSVQTNKGRILEKVVRN